MTNYSISKDGSEYYKHFFEKAPDVIVITNFEGKILEVNNKALEIYGYQYGEIVSMTIDKLFLPKSGFDIRKEINRISDKDKYFEFIHCRRDGSTFPVEINSKRISTDNEEFVLNTIHDISKLKKIREMKKISEIRYRELFDHIGNAVAVYQVIDEGNDFIFTDYNSAGQRMDKTRQEEVIGKSVVRMFPGVKELGLLDVFQRVWRTGKSEYFPIARYEDEKLNVWRENYIHKLSSGEIISIYNDLTDKKKRERDLYRLKEQFRTTLECIGDAVIATNLDGEIIFLNKVCEELSQWKREEALGLHISKIFNIVNEYTRKEVENPVEKVLIENKRKELANHTILIGKKGMETAIADSAAPIRDSDGNIQGVVLVFRDVTKDRNYTENLKSGKKKYQRLAMEYKTVFNGTNDDMFLIDVNYIEGRVDLIIQRFNTALEKKFAISTDDVNGKTVKIALGEEIGGIIEENCLKCIKGKNIISYKERFTIANEKRVFYTLLSPIIEKGKAVHIVGSSRDITEQTKAEETIRYLSFHDKLTDLYNRAYFEEKLKETDIHCELPITLMMGDVNGLKLTNDAFGHMEGDKLLIRIAEIIKNGSRKKDIIARWGGDEFIVLMPQTDKWEAMKVVEKIKRSCSGDSNQLIKPSIALGLATKKHVYEKIYDILNKAENNMYRNKLMESKSARSSLISSLKKTLWEKSNETEEHGKRLQTMALKIGNYLDMANDEIDELLLLALLHDIGKVGIPDEILKKPGPLSKSEWEIMEKHCEIGYRIAYASAELASIAEAILSHHEKWDGSGYPQGLKEEEIQLSSRIIAVIDAYDVMIHDRPYKEPVSHEIALTELERCAGTQFDPKIVEVFKVLFS